MGLYVCTCKSACLGLCVCMNAHVCMHTTQHVRSCPPGARLKYSITRYTCHRWQYESSSHLHASKEHRPHKTLDLKHIHTHTTARAHTHTHTRTQHSRVWARRASANHQPLGANRYQQRAHTHAHTHTHTHTHAALTGVGLACVGQSPATWRQPL